MLLLNRYFTLLDFQGGDRNRLLPTLIILAVGFVLGFGLERLFRYLARLIHRKNDENLHGVQLLNFIVLRSARHLTWISLSAIGAYYSIFEYYHTLTPEHNGFIQKFFALVLIACGTVYIKRVAVLLIHFNTRSSDDVLQTTSLFSNIARIIVYIIGVLVMLQAIGVSITPMLTALGVGGLAMALALQDPLSNLFAGIQIVATKRIRPGDFITLETQQEGQVTDISWRYTTLLLHTNSLLIIPNSKLAGSIVINHNLPDPQQSVVISTRVPFDVDQRQVERILLDVAHKALTEVPGGLLEPEPTVRFRAFDESGLRVTLRIRVATYDDRWLMESELYRRIDQALHQAGIGVALPHRVMVNPQEAPAGKPASSPATGSAGSPPEVAV